MIDREGLEKEMPGSKFCDELDASEKKWKQGHGTEMRLDGRRDESLKRKN